MSDVRSRDGTTIAYERSGHGPALVLVDVKDAARAIAEAVPGARRRELAGQTHNVSPDVLAPAAVEFLGEPTAARATRS